MSPESPRIVYPPGFKVRRCTVRGTASHSSKRLSPPCARETDHLAGQAKGLQTFCLNGRNQPKSVCSNRCGHSEALGFAMKDGWLTPRELAEAIGASERSLGRWLNSGEIRISRTPGGHRRIPLAEAIQFIRKIGAKVTRPQVLGLAELRRNAEVLPGVPEDQKLLETLNTGDHAGTQSLLVSWYLEGRTLPALFDGPVRAAMHRLGELWQHDVRGILIEHRATAHCIEAISLLRTFLPPAQERACCARRGPAGGPVSLADHDGGIRACGGGILQRELRA